MPLQPDGHTEGGRLIRRARTGNAASAALAVALIVSGCAPDPGDAHPESTATPRASDAGAPSPTPIAPTETTPEAAVSETIITITVDGTSVMGVLHASPATASLLAQLPLELSFEDFGNQEKIARVPAPLALDGMPSGGSAEPGTIGYYAPDQALVLYYDTVGYYNGIIPLGTFNDVATVRDAPAFTGTVAAN